MDEPFEALRRPRTVLVVEDDAAVRGLLGSMLDTPNRYWRVIESHTLQGAIDLVSSGFKPDVCMLDLNLPNGAGLGVLSRLVEAGGDFQIVVLSGFFPEEQWGDRARAISPRVHSYIEKSYLSKGLLHATLRDATFVEYATAQSGIGLLRDFPILVSSQDGQKRLRKVVGPFMHGAVAATSFIALLIAIRQFGAKPELIVAIIADGIAIGVAALRKVIVGKASD